MRRWLCTRLAGCVLAASWSAAAAEEADESPSGQAEPPSGTAAAAAPRVDSDARAPASPLAVPAGAPHEDVSLGDYQRVMEAQRLGVFEPLSREILKRAVERAETQLALGRRDEAVSLLSALVESPRFEALRGMEEARAATYLLGDALARAGAHATARLYLVRLLEKGEVDSWYRRSIARLVDLGLHSGEPRRFLADVAPLAAGGDHAWSGDVAYLQGVAEEQEARVDQALAAYARVTEKSRFWAQARYRSGLLEVERSELGKGEAQFCRVADPKQTPRLAPLFGGDDFFRVRDLARLALGRVAHEQYRFDDARYYYHLVPGDSASLPEALYESATSSYEARDYASAHSLINELRSLDRRHVYEDEAWVLDAYVDLAKCEFPRADAKLREFMARYEPVLEAVRQLEKDPSGLARLISDDGGDDALGVGVSSEVAERLSGLLRVDASHARLTRQIADLDRQLSGLRGAATELEDVSARLEQPDVVKPRPADPVANTPLDRVHRLDDQTASLRRLLRSTLRDAPERRAELDAIKRELSGVEGEAATLRGALAMTTGPAETGETGSLTSLLSRDSGQAASLEREALALRAELVDAQKQLAVDALQRLGLRLTRLLRRARAGRIETVLGRKRAIEVEIEALSQGYLPQGAIDSLDAARYLQDDEEYWPFDGEDWEDEYLGGEGLR